MKPTTDIEQVKSVARALLMTEVYKTPYSPMVVQHPFTSSGFVATTKDGVMQLIDITESEENLQAWQSFKASTAFKKLSQEEKEKQLLIRFYQYAKALEFEKLFYFALTYTQQTVVITAPADNAKQKEFLGYEWSNRKGNEGIKIIAAGGKMYCDTDRKANGTLATAIRQSFTGEYPTFTEENKIYAAVAATVDMLDFSRLNFNKAIRTSVKSKIEIVSKYPLDRLTKYCKIIKGVTYDKNNQTLNETSNVILTADNITLDGRFDIRKKVFLIEGLDLNGEKKLQANDIFICFSSGSKRHVGKVAYIESDTGYYAGGFMGIIRCFDNINAKYLFNILNSTQMRQFIAAESTGGNIQNLSNKIFEMKIPIPPIDIQNEIVEACEKIDEEYNSTRMSIEEYRGKIEALFDELDVISQKSGGGIS